MTKWTCTCLVQKRREIQWYLPNSSIRYSKLGATVNLVKSPIISGLPGISRCSETED